MNVSRRGVWFAAVLASCPPLALAADFLTVLTGGASGIYYPLGVALSRVFSQTLPGVRTAVHVTRASAENLQLLNSGRGELAFTLGDALAEAWKGNQAAGFSTPLRKLRAVAAIYPSYLHVVASAESGIRTLDDLKGKRVSVGAPSSGTELNSRDLLRGAGMTYADLRKVEYLPFGESVELMKIGAVDATIVSAGLGVGAIRDLAGAMPIVLVPISAEVVARIGEVAYQTGTIPAGTYPGLTVEVPTASVRNFLVTHESVPSDVVYAMTRSLLNNLDQLVAAHSAAKTIGRESAANSGPVPLHPGAERFYREAGLLRPTPGN